MKFKHRKLAKMKSMKARLFHYFILMISATAVSFVLYGAFSIWTYEKELSYCGSVCQLL